MCRARASSAGIGEDLVGLHRERRALPPSIASATQQQRVQRVEPASCASLGRHGGGRARRARPGAPTRSRRSVSDTRAADEHDQRADPDAAHQRIEIDAHRVAAALLLVAEHDVEIAAPGGVDAGFRGRLRRRVVEALCRLEPADRGGAARSRRTGRHPRDSWARSPGPRRGTRACSRRASTASPGFITRMRSSR